MFGHRYFGNSYFGQRYFGTPPGAGPGSYFGGYYFGPAYFGTRYFPQTGTIELIETPTQLARGGTVAPPRRPRFRPAPEIYEYVASGGFRIRGSALVEAIQGKPQEIIILADGGFAVDGTADARFRFGTIPPPSQPEVIVRTVLVTEQRRSPRAIASRPIIRREYGTPHKAEPDNDDAEVLALIGDF